MAKRKYICPNCGNKTGADILYGSPAWELVREDVEAGYLVIGGCCQHPDNPEIADGTQWTLELQQGEFRKHIYGSNAYPGWNKPDWIKSPAFCSLLSAIRALIGESGFMVR